MGCHRHERKSCRGSCNFVLMCPSWHEQHTHYIKLCRNDIEIFPVIICLCKYATMCQRHWSRSGRPCSGAWRIVCKDCFIPNSFSYLVHATLVAIRFISTTLSVRINRSTSTRTDVLTVWAGSSWQNWPVNCPCPIFVTRSIKYLLQLGFSSLYFMCCEDFATFLLTYMLSNAWNRNAPFHLQY